jgi:hypothetical protein
MTHLRRMEIAKTLKTNARRLGTIATGVLLSAAFVGTVLGHNLTLTSTITPVDGSTITEPSVLVSGTFGNSGCGILPNITVQASDGSVTGLTTSCLDGLWSWSGTWSGYADGPQSVTAEFYATHGNPSSPFVHSGSVTANYVVETFCDAPDAPAIANAYLRSLGVTNRNLINDIIPQVAHAMNDGEFGDSACDAGYADAVRDFVDELLSSSN